MLPVARSRGSITVEILIAYAIFTLTLASVTLMLGGESGGLLRETDELSLARSYFNTADVSVFLSIVSTTTDASRNGASYAISNIVSDLTPCLKSVSVTASTSDDYVSLSGWIGDSARLQSLGNDCPILPTMSEWKSLHSAESNALTSPGTAVDTLNGDTYIGIAAAPYLSVANKDGAIDPALPAAPNDIDAAIINGKPYIFAALSSTQNQLAVIDASDAEHLTVVAMRTPLNLDSTGSFPQGWRVYYLDGLLYFLARETKGAEFHIFDVSDPANPIEKGTGAAIDVTANDIRVRDEMHDGTQKRYAYMATARDSGEIAVYDVTNPLAISEVQKARTDLPGSQDGDSIEVVGARLYIGRESVPSGADLYVYDVSEPVKDLVLLGSVDIGASVLGIEVIGPYAFLSTSKSGKQVQVWNVADPNHMTLQATYALPGLTRRGLDYDDDKAYAAGSSAFVTLTGN